nr:transglycosylase SLT domain-containing protein [Sphingosinicella sp. BN140058]
MAHAQQAISCPGLISEAEARRQIPRGLLMAIAITESSVNGIPNPYAMNIAGRAYHARDLNDMAGQISANWSRGVKSIDVGCMQINLLYHGDKFSRLTDLLHSPTNVEYGANYLIQLATARGSWREGVMDYHNKSSQARRQWYGCKVWNNYLRINGAQTGYVQCGRAPGGSSVASSASPKINTSPLNIPGYNSPGSAPAYAQNASIQTGRATASAPGAQPMIGGQPIVTGRQAPGAPRTSRPISAAPSPDALAASYASIPLGSPMESTPAPQPLLAQGGPAEPIATIGGQQLADQSFDVPQPRQRVTGSIELAAPGVEMGEVTTSNDVRAAAFKAIRPTDWSGRVQAETNAAEPPVTSRGQGGFARVSASSD